MNFDRDVAFPNKIRIIDLLNKIAKGEEVPNRVRFDNIEWNRVYGEKNVYYIDEYDNDLFIHFFRKNLHFTLNDEVEIMEEKKIPEKLEDYDFDDGLDANTKCECLRERMQEIENQLDKLIDYLKSKGE